MKITNLVENSILALESLYKIYKIQETEISVKLSIDIVDESVTLTVGDVTIGKKHSASIGLNDSFHFHSHYDENRRIIPPSWEDIKAYQTILSRKDWPSNHLYLIGDTTGVWIITLRQPPKKIDNKRVKKYKKTQQQSSELSDVEKISTKLQKFGVSAKHMLWKSR
jgi:hypothetical protein